MKKIQRQIRNLPPRKRNLQKRQEGANFYVPFSMRVEGSIAESLARILRAICRLIEEAVDSVIFWLHKKRLK